VAIPPRCKHRGILAWRMKPIVLDDKIVRRDLFPFALTRRVEDIRVGIRTLRQKWDDLLGGTEFIIEEPTALSVTIPANIIPTPELVKLIGEGADLDKALSAAKKIQYPWHIFQLNDEEIRSDFKRITRDRKSAAISTTNQVISPEHIFIEEGAAVEYSILNASGGPIYIGKGSVVMEGSIIRGPFALCEGAVLKMGTKIYAATTIGPSCVAGGEIKNSVFFGFSNKAHDGYLGDSVIGEWCNLGAGTSNSNIKNTASLVEVWNEGQRKFIQGSLKCGMLMGDYSRSAINTAFNTGTVVGICCNVFGEGLTPKYIPDFSWGTHTNLKYKFEKAVRDINNWKKLKNHVLSTEEIQTLKHIFEQL
jgi:UDP-N-acetylglucosamine diphosphorylase / glucose-1-phosphate thymidylyltransferase / UDP-N-acetylgalactosamine diphosphorylase / glucosamine-1-phosphate N-acetyltransferase / galactosamine-1-phosphate N-acetyltransferase